MGGGFSAPQKTYEGLQCVAATSAAGVPLHGRGKDEHGILECSKLFAEMERCQADSLPPPTRVPIAGEVAKAIEAKRVAEEERIRKEEEAREAMEKDSERQRQAEVELHDLECSAFSASAALGVSAGVMQDDTAEKLGLKHRGTIEFYIGC